MSADRQAMETTRVTHATAPKPTGNSLRLALGSALWLGLSPVAPGSCGALLGVLIHVSSVLLLPPGWAMAALITAFVAVSALHFFLTPWAQAYWHSEDPKNFVLDEVAGYLLVPILFHHGRLWQVALWGFLSFRILDIIKVPPARQIDRDMRGALGVILDDLVGAAYAVLFLYVLMWLGVRVGMDRWLISASSRWTV